MFVKASINLTEQKTARHPSGQPREGRTMLARAIFLLPLSTAPCPHLSDHFFVSHYRAHAPTVATPKGSTLTSPAVNTPSPAPTVSAPPTPTPGPVVAPVTLSWQSGLPPVLIKIAWCESRDDPTAVNASSGDGGLFQIDPRVTWPAYGGTGLPQDATPQEQASVALSIYNADGTRPWEASESCWS